VDKSKKQLPQDRKKKGPFNLLETTVREASIPKLAHEFRTRLSIIQGALDNVLEGICGPVNQEQQKQLNLAVDSVDRMTGLVEELMVSLSDRQEAMRLNIMDVPLQNVLKRAVDSMHSAAFKEGVTLMADVQDESLTVRCDQAKIEQVLINLFRNAIKFTSRGGSVTVRVKDSGEKVVVSVVDTGVGIPENIKEGIFGGDRDLNQLRDADGGFRSSGLGLIIVKEIIDAHQGEITVESEIGSGSTFTFTLNKS